MDPNANLKELRQLCDSMSKAELADQQYSQDDMARVLDLLTALDQWIAGGGFLPDAWQYRRA